MQGKIIKGIAGFYYVHVVESGVYECKAKGVFRKNKQKPLVGDDVIIEVISEDEMTGNIVTLLPRHSELLRPAVSNVDQAIVYFAAVHPEPNYNLLDRFLIRMEMEGIPVILVFNKKDLIDEEKEAAIRDIYKDSGYPLMFISTVTGQGVSELRDTLLNKTSTLAGPSGVGKSSLVNLIQEGVMMETGEISKKIERGKHTTRHSELIHIEGQSYIMDTPGFSTLFINELEKEELKEYYPEYLKNSSECRFMGCNHMEEPGCKVKEMVSEGLLSQLRYDNYRLLFSELKNIKRY